MTTMTSAPAVRTTIEACRLGVGDHIIDPEVISRLMVREVRHVEPYHEGRDMVAVIFRGGTVLHAAAGQPIPLATDEEVAAARADEIRAEMVAALRTVADLIHGYQLPLSELPVDVTVRLADPAAVRKLAADLGLDARERAGSLSVEWTLPLGRKWFDQRLSVQFSAVADEEQPR